MVSRVTCDIISRQIKVILGSIPRSPQENARHLLTMCGPSVLLEVTGWGWTQWHGNISLHKYIDQIANGGDHNASTASIVRPHAACFNKNIELYFRHSISTSFQPQKPWYNSSSPANLQHFQPLIPKNLSNLSSVWLAKDAWVGANLDAKLPEESPGTNESKESHLCWHTECF